MNQHLTNEIFLELLYITSVAETSTQRMKRFLYNTTTRDTVYTLLVQRLKSTQPTSPNYYEIVRGSLLFLKENLFVQPPKQHVLVFLFEYCLELLKAFPSSSPQDRAIASILVYVLSLVSRLKSLEAEPAWVVASPATNKKEKSRRAFIVQSMLEYRLPCPTDFPRAHLETSNLTKILLGDEFLQVVIPENDKGVLAVAKFMKRNEKEYYFTKKTIQNVDCIPYMDYHNQSKRARLVNPNVKASFIAVTKSSSSPIPSKPSKESQMGTTTPSTTHQSNPNLSNVANGNYSPDEFRLMLAILLRPQTENAGEMRAGQRVAMAILKLIIENFCASLEAGFALSSLVFLEMVETNNTSVILNALQMLFNLSVHMHLIYQKPSAKKNTIAKSGSSVIDVSDSVYQIHVTLVRLLNLVLAVLLEQKEASSCVWGAALRLLLFLCCEDGEVNKDFTFHLNIPNLVAFFLYVDRLPSKTFDLLTAIFVNRLYKPGQEQQLQIQQLQQFQVPSGERASSCGVLNLRSVQLLPCAGYFLCWLWLHESLSPSSGSNLFVALLEFLIGGAGRTHYSKSDVSSVLQLYLLLGAPQSLVSPLKNFEPLTRHDVEDQKDSSPDAEATKSVSDAKYVKFICAIFSTIFGEKSPLLSSLKNQSYSNLLRKKSRQKLEACYKRTLSRVDITRAEFSQHARTGSDPEKKFVATTSISSTTTPTKVGSLNLAFTLSVGSSKNSSNSNTSDNETPSDFESPTLRPVTPITDRAQQKLSGGSAVNVSTSSSTLVGVNRFSSDEMESDSEFQPVAYSEDSDDGSRHDSPLEEIAKNRITWSTMGDRKQITTSNPQKPYGYFDDIDSDDSDESDSSAVQIARIRQAKNPKHSRSESGDAALLSLHDHPELDCHNKSRLAGAGNEPLSFEDSLLRTFRAVNISLFVDSFLELYYLFESKAEYSPYFTPMRDNLLRGSTDAESLAYLKNITTRASNPEDNSLRHNGELLLIELKKYVLVNPACEPKLRDACESLFFGMAQAQAATVRHAFIQMTEKFVMFAFRKNVETAWKSLNTYLSYIISEKERSQRNLVAVFNLIFDATQKKLDRLSPFIDATREALFLSGKCVLSLRLLSRVKLEILLYLFQNLHEETARDTKFAVFVIIAERCKRDTNDLLLLGGPQALLGLIVTTREPRIAEYASKTIISILCGCDLRNHNNMKNNFGHQALKRSEQAEGNEMLNPYIFIQNVMKKSQIL